MTRLIDVFAVLLVALLILLPQPSVDVYPGIQGDKTDLDRLAVLEDALFRTPEDTAVAVELSRAYLRVEQPAWAMATLQPFLGKGEYQVHQVAAYAYATLLEPQKALEQAEAGIKACETMGERCPEVARIRLQYLAELMRQPANAGVDPKLQPIQAKQLVQSALRATKAPLPGETPPRPAPPTIKVNGTPGTPATPDQAPKAPGPATAPPTTTPPSGSAPSGAAP